MEKNKNNLLTTLLIIAISLNITLGALLYMQWIDDNNSANRMEENILKMEEIVEEGKALQIGDVLGEYVYEVPNELKDEVGHYYDGVSIKLLENNNFRYYHGEGFSQKGTYSIEGTNIICVAQTEEGEHIEEYSINDKYVFKYENNKLELLRHEGNEKENGKTEAIFEIAGSIYLKSNISNSSSLD